MSASEIETFLAGALEHASCKATLLAALNSRVGTLRQSGADDVAIIAALENLLESSDLLNEDIIEQVVGDMFCGET